MMGVAAAEAPPFGGNPLKDGNVNLGEPLGEIRRRLRKRNRRPPYHRDNRFKERTALTHQDLHRRLPRLTAEPVRGSLYEFPGGSLGSAKSEGGPPHGMLKAKSRPSDVIAITSR
jgi:hypothetical protein